MVSFAFEDAQSKNNAALSEERGSLRKDPRCGSLCLDLCGAIQRETEELGFEYGALLSRAFKF